MAVSSALRAILGLAALLTTVAMIVLEIANARTPRSTSIVQTAASVAATLEALVLALVLFLLFMSSQHSTYYGPNKLGAFWFPLCLAIMVLGTIASIVVLIILGKETENAHILGGPEMPYMVGTAISLSLALAMQLIFVVVYFVGSRLGGTDGSQPQHAEGGRFPQMRMKSVPYSQTVAGGAEPKETPSFDLQSPPGSSGGRSMAETMSSIRSSLSYKVRPMDSKTRLLSMRSNRSIMSTASRTGRRPPSFESFPDVDGGFDSWDTSSVDLHNRQVLDTSATVNTRFLGALETIPASPTVSRSPSPGCALDLEAPKRTAGRSRSYSPVPRPSPALKPQGSYGELHIHPLFRADSPTPAPAATPGTSIVAAPDAARTVSVKTLSRMRSGSLPASSSPLSRQSSSDSIKGKSSSPTSDRLTPIPVDPIEEREMTPPLPEWILNAGSRTSLTEYHSRKLRDRDGTVDSGLGIVQ
ncbi:hypothetical protein SUNI508_09772 [Seiridium unicorne]|uniref:Uncharacterized protein n=1 Tax=Seiridium unicorne TaxID=138068 RepID=A0ABR2UNI3_9PEZI